MFSTLASHMKTCSVRLSPTFDVHTNLKLSYRGKTCKTKVELGR